MSIGTKQIILPAVREQPRDYDELERKIRELFRREIYEPLALELGLKKKDLLTNSLDDLLSALSSGRVYFYRGHFKGKFNSTVSRELKLLGAKWDRTQGSWKVPLSSLPQEVRLAIDASARKFDQMAEKIDKQLAAIVPEQVADKLKTEKFFDSTLYRTKKRIDDALSAIVVPAQLTDKARAAIASDYTENLKLYIKDFTKAETLKLREKIEKSAYAGNRYESLVKAIGESYEVSANKAKFLARQETSLLMSKFKESRYRDAGSTEYVWQCVVGSPKHPVRPMHKKLNGTKQRWDAPPVVDENGNRKNPGEDYNCRCTARPILKF